VDIKIGANDLQATIEKMLREEGDLVYTATEDGLDAATDVLINNLKAKSPRDTGDFQKGWKQKKKYKLQRYVGNTKTVKFEGRDVPLSNIIEYGEKSPHRGEIERIHNDSVEEMANAAINAIKNKV
jgi:hypothetical protein